MTTNQHHAGPVEQPVVHEPGTTTRAVVQHRFGPPSVLALETLPMPVPGPVRCWSASEPPR